MMQNKLKRKSKHTSHTILPGYQLIRLQWNVSVAFEFSFDSYFHRQSNFKIKSIQNLSGTMQSGIRDKIPLTAKGLLKFIKEKVGKKYKRS